MKIDSQNKSGCVGLVVRPDWYLNDENNKPVCTFVPKAVNVIKTVGATGTKDFVRVNLYFKEGESKEISVPLSKLDQIDWFSLDKRCIVNPNYKNGSKYIGNLIRTGLNKIPTEVCYSLDKLGVNQIGDTILFAAGDRVITRSSATVVSNFKLEQLPFRLDIDQKLSEREAFEGMRELISLSPEIGRVLIAHVISGVARAAFKEAGLTPCAVLVIVGESGMLKSHYIPHMTQLYNRADEIKAVTRFNSTHRFIEDVLHEFSECTAVIDDLHSAESKGIKRRNENAAEEIIRRISDDTGRGYKEGNASVQKEFRGNVVFIGEYIIGKASTIPRALVVNLTKRPDGRILDKYQRQQPLLVSTFYFYFIQWYVDHFEDIRNEIDVRLTKFREATAGSNIHGRLCDTQFYLQIAYMIFIEFCRESGFISTEDAEDEYKFFSTQLAGLIRTQQAKFNADKERPGGVDYLKLLRKLFKSNSFQLADSIEQFNPNKYDGLFHYDCLCLRGESLDKKIEKNFPAFKHNDVIEELLNKNALKLVKEKHTVQIKGLRFYAIKLSSLK